MRFQLTIFLLAASATLSTALPTWQAFQDWAKGFQGKIVPDHTSPRPSISCHPKSPYLPLPFPSPRNKICYVRSHNDGITDDSPYILEALHSCNKGGHVVFREGIRYFISTALDLTFLDHIDIDIQGYVLFSNDTTYWQANSFKFGFQNVTSFFKLGGNDVNIYGGGTLDGNGQAWYDLYAKDIYILRPVLIGIDGLHDSIISNLALRYSPQYYHFVANATNVVFDNINISGASTSANVAKNTDGWDTYRSSGIVIQNSYINNGDDCVAFKPNSTNMLVQNLFCNGSHGISVGSLGQYVGEYDIVENIYVFNASMHNTTDGARIKVWPDSPSELSGDLQGGGGSGMVNNITYDTMLIDNVDYAIEVDQCYGQSNPTICLQYPSSLTITDIVFKNFKGKTSKKYVPEIGTFACSSGTVCNNISAADIEVVSPSGSDLAYCLNVDEMALDVTCSSVYKGFN
ncbi:glycoside hydrolase family 28 protein [Amorphotheca resinae ATCC 22711]|uniref:galacturonan 1,4-alpha-galacturonidase n=1 Tax=Amorphotheca resinae ATCC 22711 TaxID=857342 RepID=A0A2T3AQZ4_AMORE|nr:glycoside hydrolase family 28 protein [Amorphotheca resinae ATCC 22711]PSS08684.1 glycoside hydrolase family 28 protein [Amorphotheca resinae ATCC 22711]